MACRIIQKLLRKNIQEEQVAREVKMEIEYKLLTENPWSRPGRKEDMKPIKKIVLHWYGNPKTTALATWNFFESRKNGKLGYGSAHFLVNLDGDIIQAMPQEEMAYHVGSKTYTQFALNEISTYPNNATLGIEMAHVSWEGEFTENTWDNTKIMTYLLLREYNLTTYDITTHHDIVGWKDCPRYFVLFPDELERFRDEVHSLYQNHVIGYIEPNSLNVRDDVMGRILGTVKARDKVLIEGYKNGWYKIRKDSLVGYASSKYISIL